MRGAYLHGRLHVFICSQSFVCARCNRYEYLQEHLLPTHDSCSYRFLLDGLVVSKGVRLSDPSLIIFLPELWSLHDSRCRTLVHSDLPTSCVLGLDHTQVCLSVRKQGLIEISLLPRLPSCSPGLSYDGQVRAGSGSAPPQHLVDARAHAALQRRGDMMRLLAEVGAARVRVPGLALALDAASVARAPAVSPVRAPTPPCPSGTPSREAIYMQGAQPPPV